MKKLFICAAVSMLSVSVKAMEPIQFGPYVGLVGSMIDAGNVDLNSRFGFTAGILAKSNFKGKSGFYIESGAMISLKGAEKGKLVYTPYYLDVPLHIGYGQKINKCVNLFVSGGATFSYGLWGDKDDIFTASKIFKENIFERYDYSFGFKAGAEIDQSVKLLVGYDWGQKDVLKIEGDKFTSRMFQIGMAYLF